MSVALIEPYSLATGIGAFTSGLYPEAEEIKGFETVRIDVGESLPFLDTTIDINYRIPRKLKEIAEEYSTLFIPSHTLMAGFDPGSVSSEVAVMVHDLERYPSKSGTILERFNRNRSVRRLNKCDYILAPSESTRIDILKYTEVDLENTYVIGEGVNTVEDREEVEVLDDYFLYIGDMQRRKNVDNLVEAFSIYEGQEELVLAGRVYNENDKLRVKGLVRELEIEEDVHFLGEVSEGELAWLYSNTSGYIHPAYFEGFGRPPVEAAAYGSKVAVIQGSAPAEYLPHGIKTSPKVSSLKNSLEKLSSKSHKTQTSQDIQGWKPVANEMCSILT